MVITWKKKWSWNTGYSADSVEWCPVEPYRNVFVCGTYQLDRNDDKGEHTKQKRLGKIYLFVINEDTTELNPVHTVNTPGILDQKWCYHTIQDSPVLGVVTSDGDVRFYRLVDENGTLNLNLWFSHSIGSDVLLLSLDWSTNLIKTDEPCVVVSDSTGDVTVLKVTGNDVQRIGCWKSHGFEAWIAAFNYWNPNVFYSGGDDCLFKCYDVRMENAVTVNKGHDAGVTSVRSHINVENQLLTGSYDEKVRLWDSRRLKSCIAESEVGGGVWRLKWRPNSSDIVLAACMYGGFRLLKVADRIEVICEYLEHESIAYGADWMFDQRPLVATCSFYDCNLQLSELTM